MIVCARALPAQEAPGGTSAGSVSGRVVAAESGQPLPGAVAILEAVADAALVAPSGGPFLGRSLTAVADDTGAYHFAGLPPGSYRLLIRHLGYHPAEVALELARDTPFRLSVGLVVNPIRLEPIVARAPMADPYGRTRDGAEEQQRGSLDAEAWRREHYLEGDAAVLTHTNVVEAVTLGESDLFRAIQRLPGVSARDDYTAGLWTRGAPWSQTRVYFDGLPLFNPVHAIGLFAGVNPDAVGVAAFLPGTRPLSLGEGAAGVVDIESRSAQPGMRGLAELSLVSGHGEGDWGSADGRTGLAVAARRSWADLATMSRSRLARTPARGSRTPSTTSPRASTRTSATGTRWRRAAWWRRTRCTARCGSSSEPRRAPGETSSAGCRSSRRSGAGAPVTRSG